MISDYDISHMGDIVAGEGDWFTACLIRLFSKADRKNMELLKKVYPEVHDAYMNWLNGYGLV